MDFQQRKKCRGWLDVAWFVALTCLGIGVILLDVKVGLDTLIELIF